VKTVLVPAKYSLSSSSAGPVPTIASRAFGMRSKTPLWMGREKRGVTAQSLIET
jgi:hypothetical protein